MIKKGGIIWLLSFLVNTGFAQLSHEENELLEEARSFFEVQDYLTTWKLLEPMSHIHTKHPELNYLMGAAAFRLNVYKSESIQYLAKAHQLAYQPAFLPYARMLLLNDQLDMAQLVLGSIEEDSVNKAEVALISAYVTNAMNSDGGDAQILVENIEQVNSDYADHTPLVTLNDSTLLFTSRRPMHSKAIRDFNDEFDENVYQSTRNAQGWSEPVPLSGDVNSILNDAAVALQPNGNDLVFFRTSKNLESSDLWLANKKNGAWNTRKKLDQPINSNSVENSMTMNLNGDEFIISSNRPGGYGGFDLYRVIRFGNGDFSAPVNLGSVINSEMDEVAPFILPDDKTLFYSSNRNTSIGGFDFFKSVQIRDTLWTVPEHLGRPLCTTGDDVHMSVSWSGGTAYFARPKASNIGDIDLFMANLPGFNVRANVYRVQIEDFNQYEDVEVILFSDDFSETVGIYNPTESGEIVVALLPNEAGILEISGINCSPFELELKFEECIGIKEETIRVKLDKI